MSDEQQYPEVVVIERDDDYEWTPWIGWRKVLIQMALRGTVASAFVMGAVAANVFVGWSMLTRGVVSLMVGSIAGMVLSWRLIENTGIVSAWLMVLFLGLLIGGAFVADAILGATSLADRYHWYWFVYAVGVSWIVSSLRAWMDF